MIYNRNKMHLEISQNYKDYLMRWGNRCFNRQRWPWVVGTA